MFKCKECLKKDFSHLKPREDGYVDVNYLFETLLLWKDTCEVCNKAGVYVYDDKRMVTV